VSINPESIEVGQCYLMLSGHVRRVTALPPGRVQFQQRSALSPSWRSTKVDILDLRSFAFSAERAVPCDWTPESDEGPQERKRGG
jgi:hypothetical protein